MPEGAPPPLFPSIRLLMALSCFFGCAVMYMLRTSLSMAIVCMVAPANNTATVSRCPADTSSVTVELIEAVTAAPEEQRELFDWNSDIQGTIMGAFFYGYSLSQVLGGYLAPRFGAKRVILYMILPSAVFTLMSPIAARTSYWALVAMRVAVGFLQGAIFPAMHSLWSVWAPPQEVSILTGISYAGTQFGNIIVLPLGGFLCKYGPDGGWASIFYLLGIVALVWCIMWALAASDKPTTHPRISPEEKQFILNSQEEAHGKSSDHHPPTPWISLLTSRAVWGCWIGHFAGDWGTYTMLVSLPSFLRDVLGLDITSLGFVSALPYVAYFIVINVGGFLADYIRARQLLSTVNMRRSAMVVGLIGQAIFLVLSSYCGCGQDALVIFFLTVAMALSGLQFSGFVVNYIDIAPTFSGTIMGIGNTVSCLSGILSPMLTGVIVRNGTQAEWQMVMWCTAIILIAGTTIFCIFAKGEVEPWARLDNKTEVEMQALHKNEDEQRAT